MTKNHEYLYFKAKDGQEIKFPYCEIVGDSGGPTTVLTSGVHGCEYPAIAATIKLFKELDPGKVKGKIKIVTIVNLPAFFERKPFVTPQDNKNPNRVFPGDENGTYSDNMIYHLFNNIILNSDYYVDLHGGDMVEDLIPFSIVHYADDKNIYNKSLEMARAYGLTNIVVTKSDGEWPDNGTSYAAAAEHGIPAVLAEVGRVGQLDIDSINLHVKGLLNVLRCTGNLNEAAGKQDSYDIYKEFIWMRSISEGLFYCDIKVGDIVNKGDKLGVVESVFGEHQETIRAEAAGKIMFLTTSPAMKKNGLLLAIGVK